MKGTIVFLAFLASAAWGQNFSVDWHVMGSGGGSSQSPNFRVDGTAGQTVLGISSSANYSVEAGFWVGLGAGGCDYMVGDINGNGSFNGVDITYGVLYLKGGAVPPDSCDCRPEVPGFFYAAGDVNGNCQFNGVDVTYYVGYLKGIQPALLYCPDCPPLHPPDTRTSVTARPEIMKKSPDATRRSILE